MLRPGGVVAFCGEPSHYGDRIAAWPKRGANAIAPLWRALMRAAPRPSNGNGNGGWSEEDTLERVVDVHAFTPAELSARTRRRAGFEAVRVSGEELAASLFGWANRTLEASADPLDVPWAWRVYAYRGYLLLQTLDRSLLEPRLPPALFYNLLVSARVPALRLRLRTPRRVDSRSSAACSCSLTSLPPMPRTPPSLWAWATTSASAQDELAVLLSLLGGGLLLHDPHASRIRSGS